MYSLHSLSHLLPKLKFYNIATVLFILPFLPFFALPSVMSTLFLLFAVSFASSSRGRLFPAMKFACNTTGPENSTQLAVDHQYSMLVFEFRQEMFVAPWNNEEAVLQRQAAAVAASAPEGTQSPPVYVYRNINLGSMFRLQRPAMQNASNAGWFLGPESVSAPSLSHSLSLAYCHYYYYLYYLYYYYYYPATTTTTTTTTLLRCNAAIYTYTHYSLTPPRTPGWSSGAACRWILSTI